MHYIVAAAQTCTQSHTNLCDENINGLGIIMWSILNQGNFTIYDRGITKQFKFSRLYKDTAVCTSWFLPSFFFVTIRDALHQCTAFELKKCMENFVHFRDGGCHANLTCNRLIGFCVNSCSVSCLTILTCIHLPVLPYAKCFTNLNFPQSTKNQPFLLF